MAHRVSFSGAKLEFVLGLEPKQKFQTRRLKPLRVSTSQATQVGEGIARDDDGFAVYKLDGEPVLEIDGSRVKWQWRNKALPGIYLQLGLSRKTIWLRRSWREKLVDISLEDCALEGAKENPDECIGLLAAFERLWDSINGHGHFEEHSDDHVFCYEFEVIQ